MGRGLTVEHKTNELGTVGCETLGGRREAERIRGRQDVTAENERGDTEARRAKQHQPGDECAEWTTLPPAKHDGPRVRGARREPARAGRREENDRRKRDDRRDEQRARHSPIKR